MGSFMSGFCKSYLKWKTRAPNVEDEGKSDPLLFLALFFGSIFKKQNLSDPELCSGPSWPWFWSTPFSFSWKRVALGSLERFIFPVTGVISRILVMPYTEKSPWFHASRTSLPAQRWPIFTLARRTLGDSHHHLHLISKGLEGHRSEAHTCFQQELVATSAHQSRNPATPPCQIMHFLSAALLSLLLISCGPTQREEPLCNYADLSRHRTFAKSLKNLSL